MHYSIALPTVKQTENIPSTHALRFPLGNDRQRVNLKDSYPRQKDSFWLVLSGIEQMKRSFAELVLKT